MGEMWGADLAQLRALAREFDVAAQSLDNTVSEVTSVLSSVDWLGPGGDQFRAEWDGHHAPSLRLASDNLAGAKVTVERNADMQEETSNDYGGGAGTPPGGESQSPPRTFQGEESNWLNDLIGDASWGWTVAGVTQFGLDLATRGAYGVWGLADSVPGGLGKFVGGAGTALAWGSVAFGAFQMGQGFAEGDYWKAGDGAITAGFGVAGVLAGAALLSNPVGWTILGLGAAWAIADIFIDGNVTEAIWNGANKATDWALEKGGEVLDGAADLAGDAVDAVSDAAGDVLDAGGALIDGAKDLFSW
ncbi:WXG100 family type VII secretion target [Promicromonospora sp. CA-289599]|uniref:WXG100 family type VII secretion target n=1 Tax=Promicromonospora sp. CA-289599 TaxID=3240014 RepID=UPI003D8CF63A